MARSPQEPLYDHLPPRRELHGRILGNRIVNYNIFTPEELAARDPRINTYFYRGDRSTASAAAAPPPPNIYPLLPFGGRELRNKPPSDGSRPPSNQGPPSDSNPNGYGLPIGSERQGFRPSLESLKYLLPALLSKPKTSRPLYVPGVTPSVPSPVEVPAPSRRLPLYPKIPDKLPKMIPYPVMDPILPLQPTVKPLFTPGTAKPLAAEMPNGFLDNVFKQFGEARKAITPIIDDAKKVVPSIIYDNLPSPQQRELMKRIGKFAVRAATGSKI